jgi:hypothetical protein
VPEPHDVVAAEPTPLSEDLQATPSMAKSNQHRDSTPPSGQRSPLPVPSSFENDEMNDAAEVEGSSSESSGSSMDESTSDSGSISVDQEPESELELEQQSVLPPMSAPSDDNMPVEVPQASIALPPKPEFAAAVAVDTPADGHNASRESSVLSDNYEPPEPEESPDEAYSPKLSPSDIQDSEMETVPNPLAQNDADIALTRKPQESVVFAFKGDALDVRWS